MKYICLGYFDEKELLPQNRQAYAESNTPFLWFDGKNRRGQRDSIPPFSRTRRLRVFRQCPRRFRLNGLEFIRAETAVRQYKFTEAISFLLSGAKTQDRKIDYYWERALCGRAAKEERKDAGWLKG